MGVHEREAGSKLIQLMAAAIAEERQVQAMLPGSESMEMITAASEEDGIACLETAGGRFATGVSALPSIAITIADERKQA